MVEGEHSSREEVLCRYRNWSESVEKATAKVSFIILL